MILIRKKVLLVGLLLFCIGQAIADGKPRRVVSTNLCTDQLLLILAAPEQIASITNLALEPNSSYMAEAAKGYPINHDETEELLKLKPELIVTGVYSQNNTSRLMERLGYRVERFPTVTDIGGIRSNIRQMAKILGREARGEAVISEMDRRIDNATRAPFGEPLPALFYQPRGYTSGSNTLYDQALKLTGWRNISAEKGVQGFGNIDLESVLLARPVQFFTSAYAPDSDSLAQRQLNHPALAKLTGNRPMINVGYRYWICGGPMIADAIEQLAEIRRR